jgi:hypothetical protein
MTLELTSDIPPHCITLEELIEILDSDVFDPSSRESLINVAPYLQSLSNNKSFLAEFLLNELENTDDIQKNNKYTPTVFVLKNTEKYILRANLWLPITDKEKEIEGFRYDILHDHNFDLLTVGFWGPGYKSKLFEYDNFKVKGLLGEKVELTKKKNLQLSENKIVLYRAKQDVHMQLPPDRISVSLNVIPRNNFANQPQYQFDESTHKIVKYIHTSPLELIVRLAGLLNEKTYMNNLNRIGMNQTSSKYLKTLAAIAEVMIEPSSKEVVLKRLSKDHCNYETSVFESELNQFGTYLKMRY